MCCKTVPDSTRWLRSPKFFSGYLLYSLGRGRSWSFGKGWGGSLPWQIDGLLCNFGQSAQAIDTHPVILRHTQKIVNRGVSWQFISRTDYFSLCLCPTLTGLIWTCLTLYQEVPDHKLPSGVRDAACCVCSKDTFFHRLSPTLLICVDLFLDFRGLGIQISVSSWTSLHLHPLCIMGSSFTTSSETLVVICFLGEFWLRWGGISM